MHIMIIIVMMHIIKRIIVILLITAMMRIYANYDYCYDAQSLHLILIMQISVYDAY